MGREVVSVESRIDQVTVYERGARVRRVARVRIEEGSAIRFVGLPLAVMEDTVRTEVEGAVVVTAIRTALDANEGAPPAAEESGELRAARRREALAAAEVQRVTSALERLRHAPLIANDPSDEPPAAWSAVLAARRTLLETRTTRELALHDQLAAARRELDEARRALEAASERDRMAGSARDPKQHELRTNIELDVTGSGEATIRVEYQVMAARWAPSYVARLGEAATQLEMRAVVAQDTGEDWTGVALRLSTAEPDQFQALPELHAQKIGRRQAEPARRGFRAPPAGAEALYADYDAAVAPARAIAEEVWDDEQTDVQPEAKKRARTQTARSARAAPPVAAAPARSVMLGRGGAAAPMPPPAPMMAPPPMAFAAMARAPGAADMLEAAASVAPPPAPPTPRLDYGNLRMLPPSSPQRGRLVPAADGRARAVAARVGSHVAAIEALALPPGHVASWAHAYDYAFASDGAVDVASDGTWHSVALTSRAASARIHHVAVPREQADVFRMATLTNPFDGPLLAGPIDVYDRGQFLLTSEVDTTPPAGKVAIGLGVDPQVKIARNAEFHEEAAGMLRGALRLVHAITIDVENLSARPIELEVRERVPVVREGDEEVDVTLGKVDPPWERWTPDPDAPKDQRLRGGHRWQVTVPATSTQKLRAAYEVKMASKLELIGGNRREP